MFARRLLVGGIGQGLAQPEPPPVSPPEPFVITTPPEGGLTPWSVTQAIYNASADKTFIGYVSGNGHMRACEYDHVTETGIVRTIHASFDVDEHSPPALMLRASDNKLLTVYTKHNFTPINRKIATNALDASAWGTAGSLDASLGGSNYTYPMLHQLTDVTGDPVHMFYRDEPSPGDDSRWCRSISTNEGSTWGAQQQIFRQPSERAYLTTWADERWVHFGVWNGLSGATGKLGHFKYDGLSDTFHKSDGTVITGPPFNFSEITEVATGHGPFLPLHVHIEPGTGYPLMSAVATKTSGGGELRYYYCRWDGASWTATDVASGGIGHPYSSATSRSSYGCTIDDGDLDSFFALVEVSTNKSELAQYTTADGGATFSGPTMHTSGSNILQTRVTPVRGPRDDGLVVIWTYGTMSHYKTWSFGIKGLRYV